MICGRSGQVCCCGRFHQVGFLFSCRFSALVKIWQQNKQQAEWSRCWSIYSRLCRLLHLLQYCRHCNHSNNLRCSPSFQPSFTSQPYPSFPMQLFVAYSLSQCIRSLFNYSCYDFSGIPQWSRVLKKAPIDMKA